jgi:hypothetical protein
MGEQTIPESSKSVNIYPTSNKRTPADNQLMDFVQEIG